jgi:hypothetical protein
MLFRGRFVTAFVASALALLGVSGGGAAQWLPAPAPVAERPSLVAPSPALRGAAVPESGPRLVGGGVLGGVAGVLAGGLLGLVAGGNHCTDSGNPDTCYGLEGTLIGAAAGYTVGVPVGTHYANHRRGNLGRSLLVSTAIAGAGAGVLAASGVHWNSASNSTGRKVVPVVLLAVPIAQIVASVRIEERTSRE